MVMYTEMKGKTALITGAGNAEGIGFATASKLASNGVNICITDIPANRENLDNQVQKLKKDYCVDALGIDLDVMSDESGEAAVKQVVDRFKGLDILVNNAGTAFGMPSRIDQYDTKAFIDTVDVNLYGVFRLSKFFFPYLKESKGSIVNLSSTAAKQPHSYNGAYASAKTAVIMLTKVMANEVGADGVRVNAVCPGLIMTGLQRLRIEKEQETHGGTIEEQEKRLAQSVPLGQRFADPSEVASVIAFLASSEASYVTGQTINICGGRTMAA